jgi:hypothetical protein
MGSSFAALTCLLALVAFPRCAEADDTSSGVMLPGLRSEPPGSVKVSSASVDLQQGTVRIVWKADAPRQGGGKLVIEMPRFGWLGESEPYPDRQFPELKILVDGSPARMESSFAAFIGPTNVTEEIRKAGVDAFAIADTPPFITPNGNPEAIQSLVRLGATEKADDAYIAKWIAQRTVRVALSGGMHAVTLTYKPRPAYGLRRSSQITSPAYLKPYCLTSDALAAALGKPPASRIFTAFQYAIPVSVDDAGTQSVSISIDHIGGGAAVVAFCGPDGKAIARREPIVQATAHSDSKGVVRVLRIDAVGAK